MPAGLFSCFSFVRPPRDKDAARHERSDVVPIYPEPLTGPSTTANMVAEQRSLPPTTVFVAPAKSPSINSITHASGDRFIRAGSHLVANPITLQELFSAHVERASSTQIQQTSSPTIPGTSSGSQDRPSVSLYELRDRLKQEKAARLREEERMARDSSGSSSRNQEAKTDLQTRVWLPSMQR